MRNFILIAAMVLASAATAQAGEFRSLITTSTPDTTIPAANVTAPTANASQPVASQEPRSPDALRADNDLPSTDMPRQNDTPRADVPRYNVRPAPVDTKRATTTPPANQDMPAVTNNEPPPRQTITTRPSREYREYHASRGYSRHRYGRLTARRIIAALHRYGIY